MCLKSLCVATQITHALYLYTLFSLCQLFSYLFVLFFSLITYFKYWTNLTIALIAQKEIFFRMISQEQTMKSRQKYQESAHVPVFHRVPKKTKQNPQRKLQISRYMSFKKQQHRFSANQQDFDARKPISAENDCFNQWVN